MRANRRFLLILAGLLLAGPLLGEPPTLYVSVLQTQSYIVGGKNPPTGLYYYKQDTTWGHRGWDNVRDFGLTAVPGHPDTMFLACGNGVFRTWDGGKHWKITTGWRVTEVLDVALQPENPGRLLAATAYGIWASNNYGQSWQESNDGIKYTFTQAVRFDRADPDRVFAGSEETLLLSGNAGHSWNPVGPEDVAIRSLAQSPADPDFWLAGTMDQGILVSRDGGQSWSRLDGAVRKETIYAIAPDPEDPSHIVAGGFNTGVLFSRDGGKTWSQAKSSLPISDIHSLAFDPGTPGRIWVGTVGRGVYYTDNEGDSWQYAGLNGSEIWSMMFIQ